jgi:hypothetical protein
MYRPPPPAASLFAAGRSRGQHEQTGGVDAGFKLDYIQDDRRFNMGKAQGHSCVGRVMGCLLLLVLAAGPVCAEGREEPAGSPAPTPGRWTRIKEVGRYKFKGSVLADKDLSGIACISDKHCLIGADEAREVQVVELSREAQTLRVIETISLLRSGSEIDIEAVAAEGNCYYIIGSHGMSKKQGERQSNRYNIFRLHVDPKTGLPTRRATLSGGDTAGADSDASAGLERASLAGILRANPVLGGYFGRPLQQKGVNIEGLAARNGHLFVGFRNPNLGGYAFVLEIPADNVFGKAPRSDLTALHRLRVGEGLGIRDMVACRSGFLLIVGNAGSEPSEKFTEAEDYVADRDFFLFAWDGKGSDVQKIGPIPDVPGKAEALTVLEETPDHITVLMLFDGVKQGRPTVYRIE